jgi:hypothetical protein
LCYENVILLKRTGGGPTADNTSGIETLHINIGYLFFLFVEFFSLIYGTAEAVNVDRRYRDTSHIKGFYGKSFRDG